MRKIIFISLVLIMGFFTASAILYARPYAELVSEERRLMLELEEQRGVALLIEWDENYRQTDAYIKEVARDKLGYVDPDETVFFNIAE